MKKLKAIAQVLALAVVLSLAACGGGGAPASQADIKPLTAEQVWASTKPVSRDEAARFLTQATFGPTEQAADEVRAQGYGPWLDAQLGKRPAQSHVAFWETRDSVIKLVKPTASAGVSEVTHSFWTHALSGQDQLRQRVAFALSEIFVVSFADGCGADNTRGLSSYLDMLGDNAFGSYRQLLERVAMHPVMGCYLSHLRNQREDAATGRVPDENFAREVMQLFSIGLYQLNDDGSAKLGPSDQLLDTYGASDISGLAKVFTGFSWSCPVWPADGCFRWGGVNGSSNPEMWTAPMVGYAKFHSSSAKTFLGVTIAAQSTADPAASLKTALDTLAAHPNVGPFIGKQLIQRLVTSNPSPAYVARVTAAFNQSGGNMGELIKAILLDREARDPANTDSTTFGKVREPVLRLSAFLRAMGAQSDSGAFLIDPTDDAATALAQTPLKSPSVFNFFRPGYVPPGGAVDAASMVAPEMQLVHESSVAAYVNFMRDLISNGAGRRGQQYDALRRDVQLPYALDANNATLALAAAADAGPLVDQINHQLMYGTMPPELRAEIKGAVESIAFKKPAAPTATEIKNRLWSALLLTVASPEFQVQK